MMVPAFLMKDQPLSHMLLRYIANCRPVICRKLHNEWCRLASEHFCFLQDDTGADDCCDTNESKQLVATHPLLLKNAPAIMAMIGSFAPQGTNVVVIIVILRSRSFSIVREAITPGTPHPEPINIGMKDFPERPNLRKILSMMNATRAMYPQDSKECKEQEQILTSAVRNQVQHQHRQQYRQGSVPAASAAQFTASRADSIAGGMISPNSTSFVQSVTNSTNCSYRYIINNPHYNCEDRKSQPSVGYDSVDLIRSCKFLSCRRFCIALSDNGGDVYITLVCDNTLCIIIKFIFQSFYFVGYIWNALHLLYDLVIFLDEFDCKETFLSFCNSSCQLMSSTDLIASSTSCANS